MTTPKGTHNRAFPLEQGGQIMVYATPQQIILQLRREIPTESDILTPSFKVALAITPSEALLLAGELLQVASEQISPRK